MLRGAGGTQISTTFGVVTGMGITRRFFFWRCTFWNSNGNQRNQKALSFQRWPCAAGRVRGEYFSRSRGGRLKSLLGARPDRRARRARFLRHLQNLFLGRRSQKFV